MNAFERFKATGKAIICFQADGCMAHDHKFKWVGIIKGFYIQPHGDKIMLADIAVMKYANDPRDSNDGPLPPEKVIAAHIRHLHDGLYVVYQ